MDLDCTQKIFAVLDKAKADFDRARGGNKAAATRGRKALSEVAALCKEGRKELLAYSKGENA